jgi:hypothetical protein
VLLGGEAWVAEPDGQGGKTHGIGDTSLVLKRAFILSDSTALGLELSAQLPTAAASERTNYGLNTIWSQDLPGDLHLDANLNAVRVGAIDAGEGRVQRGEALSLSRPLTPRYAGVIEWSGTQRAGADRTAQLLLALSHAVTPRLVLDCGLAKGLTAATAKWAFFGGATFPLVR